MDDEPFQMFLSRWGVGKTRWRSAEEKQAFFAKLYGQGVQAKPPLPHEAPGKDWGFEERPIRGRMQVNTPPLMLGAYAERDAAITQKLYQDMLLPPGNYTITQIQDSFVIEEKKKEKEPMDRKQLEAELAAMTARMADLQKESEKFAAFPETDNYTDGTLVLFTLAFKRKVPVENSTPVVAYTDEYIPAPGQRARMKTVKVTYEYAAFKAGDGYWYITGQESPAGGRDWDELINFVALQEVVRFGIVKSTEAEWLVGAAPVVEAPVAE